VGARGASKFRVISITECGKQRWENGREEEHEGCEERLIYCRYYGRQD
jgi:hypothetical protein